MNEVRPLIDKILPACIETIAYAQWRQGFTSKAVREAVLGHDLVRAEIEQVAAGNPRYGHGIINRVYATLRIGQELRVKDQFGFRVYVNLYIEGQGRRYVAFRALRLAEVVMIIEAEERVHVEHAAKISRLHRFRELLEQRPANTTVGDVYDNVVRDLFGHVA